MTSHNKTTRVSRVYGNSGWGYQPTLTWREHGYKRGIEGPVFATIEQATAHKWNLT
jgi:hypothetical protein